jgi:hypothetical protein
MLIYYAQGELSPFKATDEIKERSLFSREEFLAKYTGGNRNLMESILNLIVP